MDPRRRCIRWETWNRSWESSPSICCLPPSRYLARSKNTDPHTEKCSHRLAVHFLPKYSSAYFFDSYGIVPPFPDISAFIRRNYTVCDYKRRQLQGLTSNICGIYCCLFTLYVVQGFTAKQFVGLLDGASADRQIFRAFDKIFGSPRGGGGQCNSSFLWKVGN